MGNINLQRYYDSIGHSGKSFFNKWYRRNFEKFYKKHESEYNTKNEVVLEAYRSYMDGGMNYQKYQKVRKNNDPLLSHPISRFFIMLPQEIQSWLCCGWKMYDKESKSWELNDKVHMLSKLCKYETWDDVKITLWDKIRFWLITGYKFVE